MSAPTVTAICLTKDRPEITARAVRSFEAQTYNQKRLIIYDTSTGDVVRYRGHFQRCVVGGPPLTVGALRNEANRLSDEGEILIHWDSDDLSHPNRIAEQVALLQASGADCVGYSDMLFWDSRNKVNLQTPPLSAGEAGALEQPGVPEEHSGEAWLYLGPQKALGTSLCYWRRTWQAKPFPDQPRPGFAGGEDAAFIKGLNLVAVSSIDWKTPTIYGLDRVTQNPPHGEPRMIASIHGKNTSGSYKLMDNSDSWRRVPEWDSFCRARMAL